MNLFEDTLQLFLASIGRSEETDFYLHKFRSEKSSCFAIVIPDFRTMEHSPEVLLFHLRFLVRLDMLPALLLSGPFSEEMLKICRSFEFEDQTELSIIEASAMSQEKLKEVITAEKGRGRLPVIQTKAPLPESMIYLVSLLASRVHIVRMAGYLQDENNNPVAYRNANEFYQLRNEDRSIDHLCMEVLKVHPSAHISVSSPFDLLREIFTIKGAGTVFRQGSNIVYYRKKAAVDIQNLNELLFRSFEKSLQSDEVYDRISDYYIESRYRGAILLEEQPWAKYLSKFAVTREARGAGVAQDLWNFINRERIPLFWRSRTENSINRWYARLADGNHRAGPWTVFWKDIEPAAIPLAIQYCLDRPSDFMDAL